jgi:hypothetical protein
MVTVSEPTVTEVSVTPKPTILDIAVLRITERGAAADGIGECHRRESRQRRDRLASVWCLHNPFRGVAVEGGARRRGEKNREMLARGVVGEVKLVPRVGARRRRPAGVLTQSAGDRCRRAGRTLVVCRGEAFADGSQRPFAVMQATMTTLFNRPGISG